VLALSIVHLSVNKRRIYKTTRCTRFQKCALPILWNVFKGTAFVWNVGTKWGKLLRKQSSNLHNGSKNHFPDWQSKTELIDFKDHAYIYIYFIYLFIEVYSIMCSFLGSNSEWRILLDYFVTSMKNQCKRNEWKFGRNASGLFMTALQCVHGHPKALMSLRYFFQFLTLKVSVKGDWFESVEEMLEKMLKQLIRIS